MRAICISVIILALPFASAQGGKWEVIGRTGVPAMHAVLTTEDKIVIIDKAEPSELTFDDGSFAWGSEYDLKTNQARPLRLLTNSFCSSGSFLGDGTLVESGGEMQIRDEEELPAGDGLQSIRIFTPCSDGSCEFTEGPKGARLSSKRWYASSLTLPDGRVMIVGGSTKGQGAVSAMYNNPTYEFYPRKPEDEPNYELPILRTTIPYNLYPQVHVLPNGNLFILSNKDAVLYDYQKHSTVRELPQVPGVPRTYPLTGGSVLLPLNPDDNYRAEILVCGGVSAMERTIESDDTCARITPLDDHPEWHMEKMPNRRTMPDMTLLADSNVHIANGAQQGFAGYSNAQSPQLVPVLYRWREPEGQRFEKLMPSDIPRMYHSVAMLLPDGRVWVAGSNPHSRISKETEFRVEAFIPDYLLTNRPRPVLVAYPEVINYGEHFIINVDIGSADTPTELRVVLANIGFSTHSTHMSQRQIWLRAAVRGAVYSQPQLLELVVEAPPNANLFPPGNHWLFVLANGVPAVARQIMCKDN
ncbi:uncharacterized protein VTP21DRAFT_7219 [Calcarisporiella thermophila]|uniref:uncharacterized protein n=1 Tax=Calcarisporiella thermophila TaxID=911321 RepID=UPI003742C72A